MAVSSGGQECHVKQNLTRNFKIWIPVLISLWVLFFKPLFWMDSEGTLSPEVAQQWSWDATRVMVGLWTLVFLLKARLDGFRYYLNLGVKLPLVWLVTYYCGVLAYQLLIARAQLQWSDLLNGLGVVFYHGGAFCFTWIVTLFSSSLVLSLIFWLFELGRRVRRSILFLVRSF